MILPTLTHIFNCSLVTATYPKIWKKAIVRPIPKINSPSAPSDFRPISILPALSKALEYIVHKQITDYLNSYNLINPFQSGFRSGHSTTTALLKIIEDVREAMDNRRVTILTSLDFSKAFNSVDVDILLGKLRVLYFSDSSIAWMESYLRDRLQSVSLNDRFSSWRIVETGIPQGSVLGPLLFSIYINDVSEAIRYCRYHLYADDLQLYIHASPDSVNDSITKLNSDLKSLTSWSQKFGLILNPQKSQAILLGNQRIVSKFKKSVLPAVVINNIGIPFSASVKTLGVHIDEYLNWATQTKHVCKKVFSILHSLRRMKNFLPFKLKQILVETLIMPQFDYCDVLLSDLSHDLTQKLQRVHNACVRFICNIRLYDHISPSFNELSWLRLADRRSLHCLSLLYQILHTSTPEYLASRFHNLSTYHNLYTRSQRDTLLSVPLHRTSAYSSSFTIDTIRSWNSLPADVRGCQTLNVFKSKVKHLILERSFPG